MAGRIRLIRVSYKHFAALETLSAILKDSDFWSAFPHQSLLDNDPAGWDLRGMSNSHATEIHQLPVPSDAPNSRLFAAYNAKMNVVPVTKFGLTM